MYDPFFRGDCAAFATDGNDDPCSCVIYQQNATWKQWVVLCSQSSIFFQAFLSSKGYQCISGPQCNFCKSHAKCSAMHPSQRERVARATWALLVGFERSRAGCNCWRNCVYCVSSIFLCGEFGCAMYSMHLQWKWLQQTSCDCIPILINRPQLPMVMLSYSYCIDSCRVFFRIFWCANYFTRLGAKASFHNKHWSITWSVFLVLADMTTMAWLFLQSQGLSLDWCNVWVCACTSPLCSKYVDINWYR